ncbi:MAG: hypothetical protein EHM12_11120 [Dehalococcoidia bacterium]|nr:MAG: hypothetical protein EHM12_11120 [Dehalococcoidia bacterium]
MTQETVKLTTKDNVLKGKYTNGNYILITCDATLGNFIIDVPDCKSLGSTIFKFVRKDVTANNVVLYAYLNQLIRNASTYSLVSGSILEIVTDGENWW